MNHWIRSLVLLSIFIPIVSMSQVNPVDKPSLGWKMINKQKQSDMDKKNEILKAMKDFMGDVNGKLRKDTGVKIEAPIDTAVITKVEKNDQIHSDKKPPERIFAFAGADNVNLRMEYSVNARILTRLNFGEKVEILARTENPDLIDGTRARWYMVRRTNGEEGWVFGKFLRANPPERKAVEPEKDKNRVLELTNDEGLSVPVIGKRTSDFGYRIDPLTHKRNAFHSGIDIAAPSGTPVKAAADGVIKISEFNAGGYGNLIVVLHEKEVSTYYGHLSRRDAMNGQRVKKGDVIGLVGSTGRSTGPHLHFEVRKGNSALDPNGYIK